MNWCSQFDLQWLKFDFWFSGVESAPTECIHDAEAIADVGSDAGVAKKLQNLEASQGGEIDGQDT